MKPTPFNSETDLPPIPFDLRHCQAAAQLKERGLPWTPHVGCFVWDPDEIMEVTSPFPGRIYFILNLGHFLRIFGSLEEISRKLVWLPTYHQTRLLCDQVGVDQEEVLAVLASADNIRTGNELLVLYKMILSRLEVSKNL
ncbi:MAG: hypothetical protein OEU80_02955 [Deltaproteobacteria bacterium]|jgi:hypothetical protein|nr:hypothetical protein [Deltaproteobacteria bacterium]PNV82899.1 MAG: hypothetical protein C0610_17600 [Desulfobacteraceae bacterium]MDH3801030.1 hypothetical protein [Deltaproteobacteria bacterium]MDH3851884.1 hypothetical protein [Deltaproteobacteria bacterium]MDH3898337.1 hypothetical protein [Deltaproteobacteria bacterium]